MTSKKRRQRGSRTHGGGTGKNRRGAGNRGGRGNAGRDKHNFHNYEPRGKHGFKRPEKAQRTVLTIDVGTLDENAERYVEDGLAERVDDGYLIDARDVVDGGDEADAVKVLGGGQVHRRLEVTADDFSAGAVRLIEAEGGETTVTAGAGDEPEDTEGRADDGE